MSKIIILPRTVNYIVYNINYIFVPNFKQTMRYLYFIDIFDVQDDNDFYYVELSFFA